MLYTSGFVFCNFIEPVTFTHCTWPPWDQIDIQDIYAYIYIFFFFFSSRDSMTIDFRTGLALLAIML